MEEVTVKIHGRYVRLAKSPLMLLITALTGVSVTFAPLALFQLGQTGASLANPSVWVCFLVIYLVPGFYIGLGGAVLKSLRDSNSNDAKLGTASVPAPNDGSETA